MTPDPYAAPETAPPPNPHRLTRPEWVGLGVSTLATLYVLAFGLGNWRTMFEDFGSLDDLPLLTRGFLLPWVPQALALPGVAALAVVYRRRRQLPERRRWLLVAVIVSLFALGVCLVATRLPIFLLADKIRAE